MKEKGRKIKEARKQRRKRFAKETFKETEQKEVKKQEEQTIKNNEAMNTEKIVTQQEKKELTFVEKLEIWTKGFTEPMLDIDVVYSDNRGVPKFSGIEEYEMYEKIKKQFNECLLMSRKDVTKAWELFRKRYIEKNDKIFDDER